MNFERVPAGRNLPDDLNVIIEIPRDADPVKYEVDKASGAIFVDRHLSTPMRYPCNYGYVPHTLCGDGDPLDVLVAIPVKLVPGCVIRCRPIGMLMMEDESGEDAKILAVPVDDVSPFYTHVDSPDRMPRMLLDQITHFFEHYKDLEFGKWVKIKGWRGRDDARAEVIASVKRFEESPDKPAF